MQRWKVRPSRASVEARRKRSGLCPDLRATGHLLPALWRAAHAVDQRSHPGRIQVYQWRERCSWRRGNRSPLESLKAPGKATEARWVEPAFQRAWSRADTPLRIEDL